MTAQLYSFTKHAHCMSCHAEVPGNGYLLLCENCLLRADPLNQPIPPRPLGGWSIRTWIAVIAFLLLTYGAAAALWFLPI